MVVLSLGTTVSFERSASLSIRTAANIAFGAGVIPRLKRSIAGPAACDGQQSVLLDFLVRGRRSQDAVDRILAAEGNLAREKHRAPHLAFFGMREEVVGSVDYKLHFPSSPPIFVNTRWGKNGNCRDCVEHPRAHAVAGCSAAFGRDRASTG